MSTITIALADDDLDFLRSYSSAQGMSAEAFLAQQAHNLRGQLRQPLHPEVTAATGIIAPEIAAEDEHREALARKHE